MNRNVRIGSRGSTLALWQARWVEQQLRRMVPSLEVTISIIKTKGDKILDAPLSQIGGKGVFTREIEQALLAHEIDIAVHSLKDLPTELPDGLKLGAVCEREDVRDVFIPHSKNLERRLFSQPLGVSIGTGSLRRKCQVLNLRPDFQIMDMRGNLDTRLRKLEESDWAGILLARAGLVRLGLEERIGESLDAMAILPAVGQGALGIETRKDDASIADIVALLHHEDTHAAIAAERALLRKLEGGCQVPIGAYGRIEGGTLKLDAIVGSLDGKTVIRGSLTGDAGKPEEVGVKLAGRLLHEGALEILQEIRISGTNETQRVDV
ncbi:MAG: hydroxymethylbilane synthase [Bacteroidota bacterium]